MFPNPQDALPLPPRPNLEQYKKLAKDLVKVCATGKPEGLRGWASGWIGNVARLSGLKITPGLPVEIRKWVDGVVEFATRTLLSGERKCTLAGAQFVIARSHGFMSWPRLVKHIGEAVRGSSSVAQFEAAADAILLLQAGSEVDAEADVYGGGCTTLPGGHQRPSRSGWCARGPVAVIAGLRRVHRKAKSCR